MEKKKPGSKQTIGSPCKRSGRQRQGRKPASESRAAEIRLRLTIWKQTPESSRRSLRALAADMGTSHQLLSFYLQRLEQWQGNEQAKEYGRQEHAIRMRAIREGRPLTAEEQAQVRAYTGAIYRCMFDSVIRNEVTKLRKEAARGKLSKQQLREAKILARGGYGREIQEILAANS